MIGVSNNIPTNPSNYGACCLENIIEHHQIDVRDRKSLNDLIEKKKPDFCFHLAAQALVGPSYSNPLETFSTNMLGSANVLDSLRFQKKSTVVIMITSDKVYENLEWEWGYRELDKLGGKDPYSASKSMAEIAIRSYVETYFKNPESKIKLGITRAGNVIGGGDWAIDRIVPDCVKAWSCNEVVKIRNPSSTRPWQHVLEPLGGYLVLAAKLYSGNGMQGEAYNFGPHANKNHTVSILIDEMAKHWEKVSWIDESIAHNQINEAGLLKLNCDKSLAQLNWIPTLEFDETISFTAQWYKTYYQNPNLSMYDFTIKQISHYTELARSRGIEWAQEI